MFLYVYTSVLEKFWMAGILDIYQRKMHKKRNNNHQKNRKKALGRGHMPPLKILFLFLRPV